jgi:hypothetical protein
MCPIAAHHVNTVGKCIANANAEIWRRRLTKVASPRNDGDICALAEQGLESGASPQLVPDVRNRLASKAPDIRSLATAQHRSPNGVTASALSLKNISCDWKVICSS